MMWRTPFEEERANADALFEKIDTQMNDLKVTASNQFGDLMKALDAGDLNGALSRIHDLKKSGSDFNAKVAAIRTTQAACREAFQRAEAARPMFLLWLTQSQRELGRALPRRLSATEKRITTRGD